ncbi:MAG: serine/threonine protein kinase [Bacillariaceae sp.]|jgi:serine/threonine protein kinase
MADHQEEEEELLIELKDLDRKFQKVKCLGHGGYGSVYLAKKVSGRHVALKLMRISLDDDEDEIHELFLREVNAVSKLDCTNEDVPFKSIVYFRDWFRGRDFACIVMPYIKGGTLAEEIESRTEPYAERRIVYYALQLSDALAYAHSRGVAHHDIKSSNVLVNRNVGGRLVLTDFGSAIFPGEEAGQAFTKLFAAPELQDAYNRDNYTGLQPEKIDAFAFGCILFELVCCKRMVDFEGEQTIGEFLMPQQSADAALNLPQVCLPWLPPSEASEARGLTTETTHNVVGYSNKLRDIIKILLDPQPSNRGTPTQLKKVIRHDDRPLIADFCTAAQPAQSGEPVTIDNIQLGMFVQRGRDWNDGEADGGPGSVGVVIRLDADGEYTEVAFPSRNNSAPKPLYCRIGAENKYELQVGPTPMLDFVHGDATTTKIVTEGVIYSKDTSNYYPGQIINPNCTIIDCQQPNRIFVAPIERICIPTHDIPIPTFPIHTNSPRKPMPVPATWNLDIGMIVPLTEGIERQLVLDLFFSTEGGMDIQWTEIISIHAVQLQSMWDAYASCCEDIATDNWSNPNEKRLFHGTRNYSPASLLNSPETFYQNCAKVIPSIVDEIKFSGSALFADHYAHRSAGTKSIVLSRVGLGRIKGGDEDNLPRSIFPLDYHSTVTDRGVFSIMNQFQAYPEFVITYRVIRRPHRRIVRAGRPSELPRGNVNRTRHIPARPTQITSPVMSNTPSQVVAARTNNEVETIPGEKMCVVCMERPVRIVLIPCGHPCLCETCSTKQGLKKLKMKCPECRTKITVANKFFGKIIE